MGGLSGVSLNAFVHIGTGCMCMFFEIFNFCEEVGYTSFWRLNQKNNKQNSKKFNIDIKNVVLLFVAVKKISCLPVLLDFTSCDTIIFAMKMKSDNLSKTLLTSNTVVSCKNIHM
jgi:hypothetical protein